jgi:hypothetical protein
MDVAAEPGRDTGRGEQVEAELTAFIEKRNKQCRQTEGERRAEEAWAESERRHTVRRHEEMRAAWCEYQQGQAARNRASKTALIVRHEDEVAKLTTLVVTHLGVLNVMRLNTSALPL